jgi:hypothetical protein
MAIGVLFQQEMQGKDSSSISNRIQHTTLVERSPAFFHANKDQRYTN